ncbi:MAG TPA: aminotransferase class I/II-fold pyridoxal phosphate-dependent enzyme, partial [Chthonomonadales bacterium]|nr:aminotransferase class I/II-fold pyridoxal phosphate-dependent enzyme [Chthonomonadales bacterium]
PSGYAYARADNPNRQSLEQLLAELERGEAAASFSSGQAATTTVLQSLRPGDHVLAPLEMYWGTASALKDVMAGWGVEASFVDMTEIASVRAALRPSTRLIWLETPSNPRLRITDIRAVVEIARSAGCITACDNTCPTPILQRPLDLGVDLAIHSATKYLGGHSDVLGGAVAARSRQGIFERIRMLQANCGAVPSPFDCWLLQRSIATLPVRIRAQSESAMRMANYLSGHPRVKAVHYPGLPAHPGHDIARRQMAGFGALLSFELGSRQEAIEAAARVKLFTRATSLGAVESLIEHRASVEPPDTPTPQELLRVSVGLEHVDDLLEDLEQAIS